MAKKDYTKEEVIKLLKQNFEALAVYQLACDYDDEYRVLNSKEEIQQFEVVSTMTAITNEEDFQTDKDKNKFLKDVIETLLKEDELLQIGAYSKLAEDLFWREL